MIMMSWFLLVELRGLGPDRVEGGRRGGCGLDADDAPPLVAAGDLEMHGDALDFVAVAATGPDHLHGGAGVAVDAGPVVRYVGVRVAVLLEALLDAVEESGDGGPLDKPFRNGAVAVGQRCRPGVQNENWDADDGSGRDSRPCGEVVVEEPAVDVVEDGLPWRCAGLRGVGVHGVSFGGSARGVRTAGGPRSTTPVR